MEIHFPTLIPRVFSFSNMAREDLGTRLPFSHGTFSNDVTSAILVFQNNKTVATLVFQKSSVGVEPYFHRYSLHE